MRKWFGKILLKLAGWKGVGEIPQKNAILITAPHTSNWDYILMMIMAMYFDIYISWMGKHTLFRPPLGWLLRWTGGIPIDRRAKHNVVDQMADKFAKRDDLILAIPAEGTRSYVEYWKSGFYHIAKTANVPIILGYLDYKTKTGGFGPPLHVSDDVTADMDIVRDFYKDKFGKYPEKFGHIRLRAEDKTDTPEPNKTDTPTKQDDSTSSEPTA